MGQMSPSMGGAAQVQMGARIATCRSSMRMARKDGVRACLPCPMARPIADQLGRMVRMPFAR